MEQTNFTKLVVLLVFIFSWGGLLAQTSPYTISNNCTILFENIEDTGTALNLSDDGEANISLPFSFVFYGNNYAAPVNLRVGNNGAFLFNNSIGDVFFTNNALPTVSYAGPVIMPFWDDLDEEQGNVYWEVKGSAPFRRMIIQWERRPHFPGNPTAETATFQAVLFETSNNIAFIYEDVFFGDPALDYGASATIGLQNTNTQALQYSFNTASLTNVSCILFDTGYDPIVADCPLSPVDTVFIYDDANSNIWSDAAVDLGYARVVFGPGNFAAFNGAVGNADPLGDIVVVDESLGYSVDFSNSNIATFAQNGGRVIFYTFEYNNETGLGNLLKAEYNGDLFVPFDVYDWGGSSFFDNLPNPVNCANDVVALDGNALVLTPMAAGANVVAGLTSVPFAGDGVMIQANEGRTVANGFSMTAVTNRPEAVIMAANQLGSVACAPDFEPVEGCDEEAAFTYDDEVYCTNGPDPVITITGSAGAFTYEVVSGGPTLDLNPLNGEIDLSGSDPGEYTVTNTVGGGGTPGVEMVISGVIDGPITGGLPKAVEFYVLADIADLSVFGFGSANNGGGTNGQEYTFPAVAVAAGTHIWVATEATQFTNFFGFAPTYTNGTAPNINGDDAIELFKNGTVVDIFGQIDVDGTGQPWNHEDGWAYRINNTGPDGNTFQLANWTFSGANALDGETTNDGAEEPFPVGSYSYIFQDDLTFTCTQTILINEGPVADAGSNQLSCGLAPVPLFAFPLSGNWSGGAGTFSEPDSAFTFYSPDPSEIGTTVVITWTADDPDGVDGPCSAASDEVLITFVPEPDAEFAYSQGEYCPNEGLITPIHTTGADGIYTYGVIAGGPFLSLDPQTGVINTNLSDLGAYTVTNTVGGCGNMVITGVIDGPVTGGLPKAVEFFTTNEIPDLSAYGFGSANNGGGTDGVEFTFPAVSVPAGTFIWVATESTVFTSFFGFPPTYVANLAASINGDDAIELFCNGQVIDIFGEIDQSGTGQPWEYMDGWAYRNGDTGPNGPGFELDQWFFSGPNSLDGILTNDQAEVPFPIGSYGWEFGTTCPNDEFTFTVVIDDNEAPDLDCPADITLTLGPGECGDYINFIISATDNCDPNPVIEQTAGDLFSGDFFPIGDYTYTFVATDQWENESECTFEVSVLEFPFPTEVLTCNDLVQVSLDENGQAIIGADQVLEGGPYGCYDDYIVVFVNDAGGTEPAIANCDNIGQTLTVMVTDPDTGNACWGEVEVEDKLAPELFCTEVNISCTFDYNLVAPPFADDNCDVNPTVLLTNQDIDDEQLCEEGVVIVYRTYVAVDNYGNTSDPCTQVIYIQRPTSVDFPNDITWECDQYAQYPNITEATALNAALAGFIDGANTLDFTNYDNGAVLANTGSGIPGGIEGLYCNYGYTYADDTLATCGNTFKIIRTWTVLDWCNLQVITSNQQGEDNVQIIKVVDATGPVIIRDPFTVSANVPGEHPQPCASTGLLLPATITDNCNDYTVRIYTPAGEAIYVNGVDGKNGGFIPAPGLELGTYFILYQAEDVCGNISELFVEVNVIDDIVPTAICDEITEANLSSDGLAVVYAETFDDGSYDNCCLDEFLVRRMDGDCEGNFDDFGPTVTFCCSDAGTTVMVVFRAVDCFGNYNDCMVEVNVNDKIPPVTLYCPPTVTITCDEYLENYAAGVSQGNFEVLDIFGEPTFFDNCDLNIDTTVTPNLNSCTEGTIIRTWTATDNGNNGSATCSQSIVVVHVSDWVVEFPADVTVECTDGQLPDTGEPEIFFDECELVAVSHEDQIFYIVPDACYKIERTWNVINWCIYDDFGYNAYTEVSELDLPGFQDWDGDGDDDARTFRDGWNNTGTPGTPDGYITWKQIIKVIDEEAPEFMIPAIDTCIVDTDCDMDLVLPYPVIMDDCSPTFDVDITGDLGNYDNISGDVTVAEVIPGEYEVTYAVTDNCGNTRYQTITVVVEDCKKPTPYCVSGLVVEIMQTGMVELWASDFDAGSFDNCGPVQLSFSTDVNDINRIFTCDDLGQVVVELWVTDGSGNQDFCSVLLLLQDNMNACGSNVTVAGALETEQANGVEGVMVDINGGLFQQITPANGQFSFDLQLNGDYTVTPMLDVDADNGVTTYDLVLVTRHILQIDLLDSPYQIIAADANKTETVTTLDMVAIRKVILQIDANFQGNTSWRFVDADHVFANPQNPWMGQPFPEVISYNNIDSDDIFADFVAVKVGDVNGSAAANANMESEERSFQGTFNLQVEDRELQPGQMVQVDFTAADAAVYGYQFTLEFDREALRFAEILSGVAGTENFGLTLLEEGAITTSWNEADLKAFGQDEVVFSLVFEARQNTLLSEVLSAGSRFTSAEAYGQEGLLDVQLTFSGKPGSGFALYQNVPNPFRGVTSIGFELPQAASATLVITDMSGKVLRVIQGDYAKGYNEVRLADLQATGVLYYQLDTDGFTATRKMVIFE